ncbi:hypothetical protein [Pararhodobacter marinus]|uniref:hypothetical protein n=1 Tax=Pararhodobacter marinus TaxID=2184063 RepID=UPI00143D1BC8|nr:hypothetical protein [Pararhodobacter marinus]
MVILAGMVIGAVWGYLYARRNDGTGKDIAQYAAVWGIIGAIVSAFIAVGLDRLI